MPAGLAGRRALIASPSARLIPERSPLARLIPERLIPTQSIPT
jgi:hypothetical protein